MLSEEIANTITQAISGAKVEVHLEGSHAHLNIIAEQFDGLMPVKRQQLVYAALAEAIASGAIHAVHMKCYTPAQWADQQ